MSIHVGIGSFNKIKIISTKNGFEKCFPAEKIEFHPFHVETGTKNMPINDQDMLLGAQIRAKNALIELENILLVLKEDNWQRFGVGLEGGLAFEEKINRWLLYGWVAILRHRDGQISFARTASMIVPSFIVDKVISGQELGNITDQISDLKNTREKHGAFGILTDNLFTRELSFTQAIILACAPFYNRYYQK
jgi:inosine/xanthosine triphosphatase